jgi:hypothetical protein
MSTLTIHLRDDEHERLKALAESKSINVDELAIEIATVALDNNDARFRYETRSARGNPDHALNLAVLFTSGIRRRGECFDGGMSSMSPMPATALPRDRMGHNGPQEPPKGVGGSNAAVRACPTGQDRPPSK